LVTIIFIGLVFSVASLVHGVCGFGFSMISVGILSLALGPKTAVPLDVIASAANCFYLTWLLRKDIVWRDTVVIIILSMLFVPFGTLYLRHIDASIVIRSLGAVILIVSIITIFKKKNLSIFAHRYSKWIAGAISGLLGGAFNIPGPPLVLYSYNSHLPLRNAMANLQLIFSAMTFMIIFSFWKTDLLNWQIVGTGAAFMPLIILFTFVGSFISRWLKTQYLSTVINVSLLLLGITLVFRG